MKLTPKTQPLAGRRQVASLILLCGLLLSTAAFPAGRVCLTLKSEAAVDQGTIHLADVAVLTGGTNTQLARLKAIVVATTLLPGQTRLVNIANIRLRLKQAGIDVDAVAFKGPLEVRVFREAAALPVGSIEQAVEAAIRSRMPWKDEAVTIHDISFDTTIPMPTGQLTYQIVPNRHEDYLGRTLLALHLFVNGEPVRKIWVNAVISVMADVVTVVRPLGKHQHIEAMDLSVQRRDLAGLPSDTVQRIEDALGNRTTRMIYPNTVLKADMVASPPLVRRGDVVKIIANAGPMTITATGLARQQGGKGEMVRVTNTDSNRVITARVTGPGAVEVEF